MARVLAPKISLGAGMCLIGNSLQLFGGLVNGIRTPTVAIRMPVFVHLGFSEDEKLPWVAVNKALDGFGGGNLSDARPEVAGVLDGQVVLGWRFNLSQYDACKRGKGSYEVSPVHAPHSITVSQSFFSYPVAGLRLG
jgi:hypothetical protein